MRVPAIIYADESLLRDIDDKVYEQAVNVATLPGIVGASYADAGCPLGIRLWNWWRRASLRPGSRRRCPSWQRMGFDISCGVRTMLTRLSVYDVRHVQTGYTLLTRVISKRRDVPLEPSTLTDCRQTAD